MTELKPCPFCGKMPQITTEQKLCSLEWNENYPNNGKGLYIEKLMYNAECTCCKLVKCFDSEERTIEAWNTRIPDIVIPTARLQEICEAEAEGRLIIPLKLDQEVYDIESGEIVVYKVREYNLLSRNGINIRYWAECVSDDYEDDIDFWSDDIGKTVFLTKEQAEAALSKGDSNEKD